MADAHILVVDDEVRYLRLLRFNLEAEGYRVDAATSGEDALVAVGTNRPDLLILDVMLPGIDGFEVCRRIREVSTVPVIMLTARGAEGDKVSGLRVGADDYITKPFSAQELLARVDAVLRRARLADVPRGEPALEVGDLRIDFLARRVSSHGREVALSPTEYRLLACLAASPGAVITHDHLLEKVWDDSHRGEHDMLRVTLWRLRQKLEDDPSTSRYIITRPGVGYMLTPPS